MHTLYPRSAARRAVAAPIPRPPPVMSMTPATNRNPLTSAPAQEKLVEIGHAELVPGRPPVVAAAGALGLLHVAQQRVHLRGGERAMRAHRRMACHGSEQLVLASGQH